jgi:precorrin-6B methylase 2
MRARLAAMLLLFAACERPAAPTSPAPDAGASAAPAAFPCREDYSCPAGYECVFSTCWPMGKGKAESYIHQPGYQKDADLIRDLVFEALALRPGMSVIDIGTGTGLLAKRAALAVQPGGRVWATDINENALTRLRKSLDAAEFRNVELRHAKAERDTGLDDVPRNSIDRVLVINSAKFGRDGDRAQDVAYLRAIRDRMKPGGELVYHLDWIRKSGEDLDVEGSRTLFAEAGLELAREIAQPAHIPAETWFYGRNGEGETKVALKKGFVLVFRRR